MIFIKLYIKKYLYTRKMNFKCNYCNKILASQSSLNVHLKRAKYCINKRSEKNTNFECNGCDKKYTSKQNLNIHMENCVMYQIKLTKENYIKEINFLNKKLEEKDIQLEEQKNQYEIKIQQLQDKLENLAIKAIQSTNFEDETVIDINQEETDFLSDSDFVIEETDNEEEEKQLPPLEVGKGYTIEHREEDGYINVTNLCKAGGKQFKAWNRLDKTKAFIRVLSSSVLISTDLLIKTQTGGLNENRGTWVHPQVAINIAQWISPQFDVKVSGWVYEIMMTGKVDITNTTSFKKLQEENNGHKLRIQYLTKKYVKSQPRTQYQERNVVYILTTERMKKDRVYVLGKANNLTHRLSTYNKSDEHEVVYYQSCGDEETMGCVETMVFHQLQEYREQANRERFILPEKKEIELFSDIINKSVEFFKK